MSKKLPGKLNIGIFAEGSNLHVVKLLKTRAGISLIDAQVFKFSSGTKTVFKDKFVDEPDEINEEDVISIEDTENEIEVSSPNLEEDPMRPDNASVLLMALGDYSPRSTVVAFSLAEPNCFYYSFESGWGLKGKKLVKKVIEEIAKEKTDKTYIKPDCVSLLKTYDGSIQAAVREEGVQVLNLFHSLREYVKKRLPPVAFIETLEISLVNMVRVNYILSENDISLIIYIGDDFTRFIFLRGEEVLYIAPIIASGAEEDNITNFIYKRIFWEMDSRNIPKINNIILAGRAKTAGIDVYLLENFSQETSIEVIQFPDLASFEVDKHIVENLSDSAVALGAAWRAADTSNDRLIKIDLTPTKIKEGQKIFKLGLPGWLLFFLIPLLAFFTTIEVATLNHEYEINLVKIEQKKMSIPEYDEVKVQLDNVNMELAILEKSYAVYDSMLAGTKNYNRFLQQLMDVTADVGSIWFTEIIAQSGNEVLMRGFSIYRGNIADFIEKFEHNANLLRVEMETIREKNVYKFEILASVSENGVK